MKLIDNYNRIVDYLRISVNHDCNFHCVYCDQEGYRLNGNIRLSARDVFDIVNTFARNGNVKKVKITGGEPLVHPEIIEIIREISKIRAIKDISMTTNGFFLEDLAQELKDAGLNRINISLCSLNRDTFKEITGVDGLDQVLRGIDAAKKSKLEPIKINFVLLKDINDYQLDDIINFCAKKDVRLQLIELHNISSVHGENNTFNEKHFIDVDSALKKITIPVKSIDIRELQSRKVITYENGLSIEVIKLTPAFCKSCSKLRITAEGKIKPCLMQTGKEIPLLDAIRSHAKQKEIKNILITAMNERKPYSTEK
ncbi:MAG: GTP 3',8-cyclase MoaA [Promethearchaeota archaeon]